jgi:hypothetical protein
MKVKSSPTRYAEAHPYPAPVSSTDQISELAYGPSPSSSARPAGYLRVKVGSHSLYFTSCVSLNFSPPLWREPKLSSRQYEAQKGASMMQAVLIRA